MRARARRWRRSNSRSSAQRPPLPSNPGTPRTRPRSPADRVLLFLSAGVLAAGGEPLRQLTEVLRLDQESGLGKDPQQSKHPFLRECGHSLAPPSVLKTDCAGPFQIAWSARYRSRRAGPSGVHRRLQPAMLLLGGLDRLPAPPRCAEQKAASAQVSSGTGIDIHRCRPNATSARAALTAAVCRSRPHSTTTRPSPSDRGTTAAGRGTSSRRWCGPVLGTVLP